MEKQQALPIPTPADTVALGEEIIKVVEEYLSASGDEYNLTISQEVVESWDTIVDLIIRRIFNDQQQGDILIDVNQIDFMHRDAASALKLGFLLPLIDFQLLVKLGYIHLFWHSLHF
jgi:hypothetical protein